MKRGLFLSILLLLCTGCSLNQSLTVSYSRLNFNLPPKPVLIALGTGPSKVFIAKYSRVSGEKYIGLAQETLVATGNCGYKQFFEYVLHSKKEDACGAGIISDFKRVFLNGAAGEDPTKLYYSFNTKNGNPFIFLVLSESVVITVDSDFMDREQLIKILPDIPE